MGGDLEVSLVEQREKFSEKRKLHVKRPRG